jgi:hypothetical protein
VASGRDTGKGLVTVDFGATVPPLLRVKTILFHNFNFDGDELKEEHKQEIKKRIVPQIIQDRQSIRIIGHASKKGDAVYNRELSRRRALAVRKFLLDQRVPEGLVPLSELHARGKADSRSKFSDDELDRAVSVEFIPKLKPPKRKEKPPQPPLVEPPPAPIIHPPVPFPIPVPKDMVQRVVIREVYVSKTLIAHDMGDHHGDPHPEGWRRVRNLTVVGTAPFPFEMERDHTEHSYQWFASAWEAATSQRMEYRAVVYFYKYDPVSTPPSAPSFALPNNRDQCDTIYISGTPVDKPPVF